MSFTLDVWQRNLALYQKTLALPFNQALAKGSLSKAAFCHYVIQDAHYLEAYGRALAVCAAKAYNADEIIFFTDAAKGAIVVERELHNGFMQDFNISKTEFETTALSLACHHYTSFLTATAWSESYPVAIAALLPCFWIYAEVGKDIINNANQNTANEGEAAQDNPYQAWIDTYAGEEFNLAVDKVKDIIDQVAARCDADTIEKMHQAYTKGAELEWLFWESAYDLRTWPDGLKYDQIDKS
ncbi:thiaminase/transcriptional activator TenA [Acinetobacter calcoaceticus]|uniref:Aminopyrimidine aminohydrolase n=1 Tax=Acinetobacter calcoaceticus TaxID=471 RepID=A0A4R1XA92_ACICA|nr:thiaminase/transcriptional activator TenA [Acinetobacter calcoaceticus]